ncbi:DNA/RNA helicase, superfamily II [Metallosphaera yellowstonensis MK1]|uniref:DNA/RNA helicase, superfamily II n=1 Tax=Metallosphaera yellowstonensis MK1 TaxID=671065 RepID=H2C8I2_9CREN|nr:DEAD/DEAH box helicase [Metallosphaera yellowstonensis]EHP68458.1 DNA/RNA helicase, superfamily II [Metallosphaera yellowstonensis MK1]
MTWKTFYLRHLTDEDLRLLEGFSDYLGKETQGHKFVLNLKRATAHGLSSQEVLEILDKFGVQLSQEERRELQESLDFDVFFELEGDKLIVRAKVDLSQVLKRFRVSIPYDRLRRRFVTHPYYYHILRRIFKSSSLRVRGLDLSFSNFQVGLNVELREYQREALDAWKRNGMRGVISLPTGAGKTLIGLGAIREAGSSTLIVTFTNEQLRQWLDSLKSSLSGTPKVGIFYSEKKEISPITVTTYQSAIRHLKELSPSFKLLIIDEAHHLPAEKFKNIALGLVAPYRIALSATPFRSDGKHVELFRLMGGLVYYKPLEELVSRGYLANFRVIQVKLPLTVQERERYTTLLTRFRSLSKGRTMRELVNALQKGDVEAAEALRVHNEMRMLTALTQAKLNKIREIVELNKEKKVVIFTQYVEHAETISRFLGSLLLTGKMSKGDRVRVLEEFKESKKGVLVLTTVGDEGLDIPDANVGIIVAGTSSKRQFIQRLGRLLRNSSGDKTAILYELITQGTSEEYQAKKRKSITMEEMFYSLLDDDTKKKSE